MIEKLIRINVGEYDPKNHSYVNREKINEIIDTLNKLTKEECVPLRVKEEIDWSQIDKEMEDGIRRYNEAKEKGTLDKEFPVITDPLSTYKAKLKWKISNLESIPNRDFVSRKAVLDLIDKE